MTDGLPRSATIQAPGGDMVVMLGGYQRATQPTPAVEMVTDRTAQNVPPQVDLRPFCTRVEDQGKLGSCTANAVVGAVEVQRKKLNMDPSDLSRLFVYYNTRRLKGTIDTDSGATTPEAIAAFVAYGAPRADLWPYDLDRWKDEPPKEVYEDAARNDALQYACISKGAGVLGALAAGFPVVLGIDLPLLTYQIAGFTGAFPPLSDAAWNTPYVGGHAMLIVGYDLLRKHYVVRNSFGPRWGQDGYALMPFDLVDRGSQDNDLWVIGRLEQEGGATLRQPDTTTRADKIRASVRSEAEQNIASARQSLRDRLRGN